MHLRTTLLCAPGLARWCACCIQSCFSGATDPLWLQRLLRWRRFACALPGHASLLSWTRTDSWGASMLCPSSLARRLPSARSSLSPLRAPILCLCFPPSSLFCLLSRLLALCSCRFRCALCSGLGHAGHPAPHLLRTPLCLNENPLFCASPLSRPAHSRPPAHGPPPAEASHKVRTPPRHARPRAPAEHGPAAAHLTRRRRPSARELVCRSRERRGPSPALWPALYILRSSPQSGGRGRETQDTGLHGCARSGHRQRRLTK